ncbi:MAG: SDR family NAD(P)-dependent oxidoreductase [Nitrospira sp.]|nr:SDR family NAD(P)-dependent oxidoreductase [Nitrospira sp.]
MTKKSSEPSEEQRGEPEGRNRKRFDQPIAIVGMACRFPGAPDLQAFWRLLEAGVNAVSEGVPGSGAGRVGQLFPDAVQSKACRYGAYLDGLDLFDAAFFRISPVEAQLLDPQQRLMLETSWLALEDAGMDPERLRGSRTGVYAGISNNEYRRLILASVDSDDPAASLYTVTGTSYNTAIGRVAFALGLEGAAMAVDTACSSSLVAIHQAVTGLQRGETNLALAGGVHTILSGRLLELRANAGMLSPDGRCATFDAAANGYVRGEGCGIVVLKRLSEAEADGDRIWGVIRSTALNQDGASPGLTVPNGAAQERCIVEALSHAGVLPSDVDYVEAHGTGTIVGDPIELQAMGMAYAKGRDADRPLLIGSVKTNFGHLESAAGVAGLIKVILAMQRGVIPKHLHFQSPTPQVDWTRLPLQVTAAPTPWPRHSDRPPLAGVSGFGWSGTNAHVLVEGYPAPDTAGAGEQQWPTGAAQPMTVVLPESTADLPVKTEDLSGRTTRVLPLSGKSDGALRDLAKQYLSWLDEHERSSREAVDPLLADMAWTAGVGRSHFSHRAGVVFHDATSLRDQLKKLAEAAEGQGPRAATTVAFAFTGQASQWVGMGEALYASEPVVRAVLDRCDEVLRETRGVSLLDVMFGRAGASGINLHDMAWTQPAIYALECALTSLWASVGIRPDVVMGHSLGELAAAQAAGVFSLEDGLRFAATRGALMATLPEAGAMAAVFAPASQVAAAVREQNALAGGAGVSIAADNGSHQVVSGSIEAVEAISERFQSEELLVNRLNTTLGAHSALVEPALDDLEAALDGVAIQPPSLTLISNLTGRAVEPGEMLNGTYWRRHAREPVAFASGVRTLTDLGVDLVMEIGPHAVLGPMLSLSWPESEQTPSPVVLWSLRQPSDNAPADDSTFVKAVAGVYAAGLPVCFAGLFAGEARRRISLPGYPFQRERHWIEVPKRRRQSAGHPLLGTRHESARGEIAFETELFPSDPAWMNDHRVFDRVIAPGALYGALAATASLNEGTGSVMVEDFLMQSALVFPEDNSENGTGERGRTVQVLLDASGDGPARRVQILSKGGADEAWTLHAEGRVSAGSRPPEAETRVNLEGLKADLSPMDVPAFYRAKAGVGIDLGPSLRTLGRVWSRPGEALGEVTFPEALGRNGLDVHPLLLDGCFQVIGAARNPAGDEDGITYLPFGCERLWLAGRLPDRVVCHVRMRAASRGPAEETGETPEVLAADLRIYDASGTLLGEFTGYTVKRATRAALLSATEEINELLYEVVWRDRALAPGMPSADFLTRPATIAARLGLFTGYLTAEGVEAGNRAALLEDLERLSWSYALMTLDKLGWERTAGEVVDSGELRQRFKVGAEHERLFRRMMEMLAKSGVLATTDHGFVVKAGTGDALPEDAISDPDEFASRMAAQYPHGANEIGLFRRSANALSEVLLGRMDPLTLLFSSGEPTAADLYKKAPVARAANRMLADAIAALLSELPDGRRLRVLEVGAGTGSATAAVLPELPDGRFDFTYTDISAGFFAEAESRFGGKEASIEYRVLDIETEPLAQGFDAHGYDLILASNVLHATRYLNETLDHCLALLAPSGQLMALENLRGQGWLDLTFGQLDGWWRFADDYRPHHALASPAVWRRALGDAGFGDVAVLGVDESDPNANPDRGVIVAQGPAKVIEAPGVWVMAADRSGVATELATELAARNQTVVLAGTEETEYGKPAGPGVFEITVEPEQRESWQSLFEKLPRDVPLHGVVHFTALDGHGAQTTTADMAKDVTQAGASALALVQALIDSDATPAKGLWLVTRGAQVVERERGGELAGATLWGFGKVVAREAVHLQPRMIDLDPEATATRAELANELLYPDHETHIAYRLGRRQAARLIRAGSVTERLMLPEESGWLLEPDAGGSLERMQAEPLPARALEPRDVRVAIGATGLNFWDVFRAIGLIDVGLLGGEFCGRVLETGAEVSTVSVGDLVVGLAFGTFGSETVTREEMVTRAPAGVPVTELATMPTAFVSAVLSFDLSGLEAGERVLIHTGAGGVGLAAIQMAQAAGAEVFATASARKQAYLRSLGVTHLFDSRTTAFGKEILDATGGVGVDVALNSLTGEGFIDASLSCLKQSGRFVELARVDIYSEEQMATARPDVAYHILKLDVLKEDFPAEPGDALRRVMKRLEAGELSPIIHSRWPLTEAGPAMKFMRAARHIGKIVLATSPIESGRLRQDRTYLVTGGLGGIGCVMANWLADREAGTIVLNGRRAPDTEAEEAIDALRKRGVTVRVELADVTDATAMDRMLERMDRDLPPLGGVIHSVGVLSDGAIGNQTWEKFETVLWPKVLGAWHLHRATEDRDLDFFILFSSIVGVMGNPGQANHAAANAFLDQLAGHRRALGLPGQAIAWGAWSGLGEAEEQRERIDRQQTAFGGGWFTPQQGLKAFDRLVRQDATTSVVMSIDWSVFAEAVADHPPLLEDLLSATTEGKTDAAAASGDLLSRLRQTPAGAREELLVAFLQREVQAVLRLPSTPAPTVGFFDLGMDSLMAVELRNRLNRAFAEEYTAPNTVVFDYPDIATLARHLVEALGEIGGTPAHQAQQAAPPAVLREDDGIAIIGMACRFPGAPDLPAFWRLLEAGANAVADRRTGTDAWSDLARDIPTGYAAYCRGAFVEEIDKFDAGFFGIRPIEARLMDPRQRMMLETSWQAIEDAGMDPERLRGSRTGVYAGIGASEYRDLMAMGDDGVNYLGTAASMAVGRVAFHLGLEGPTMPVELNCASSLVALHHAVAALQRGEVNMALVGGVSAILSSGIIREMADLGMLSRTGECKTFEASADGFVRGEGCGMVVLKRLGEAKAGGDRIWGVIRGSAVNQNGASAGPTVPNGPVQERVIEEALSRAGVSPADVDYLEAHGSASELGDTIEVQSAAAVYGQGREADRPLLIGSVKTNIGHLEPAAGVAGLIKVILAMNQSVIPRHLHFRDPNPNIEWDRLPVRVTSEATDWPVHPDRPRFAAISAFGISGTNAHVVVEGNGTGVGVGSRHQPAGEAQPVAVSLPKSVANLPLATEELTPRKTRFLPLSGKSEVALRELAKHYLSWLDMRDVSAQDAADPLLADMAWTAGVGRSHFAHRAGVVFHDAASLRDGLKKLAEADEGVEPRATTKVAFAYTGQASQWIGMGEALYASEPVVRVVLDRCDAVMREAQGASLLEVLFGQAPGHPNDAAWMQPALYALECALTALWASVGIRPSVVMGHSLGELAAAQAAGVFSLEDGLRFAAARGVLMGGLPEIGAQAAALDDLQAALEGVAIAPPSLTLVNYVTGRVVVPGETLDATYWYRQASEPGAPDRCVHTLGDMGVETVVEIGQRTTPAWTAGNGEAPVVLSSLPEHDDTTAKTADGAFVEAVAEAYAVGLPVSFAGLFAGETRRRVSLPTYPFQRRRHWIQIPNRK